MTYKKTCGASLTLAAGEEISLGLAQGGRQLTVSQALAMRRSTRQFALRRISSDFVGQLCWAAQGITGPEGVRTAPSAGALYPVSVFVVDRSGAYAYEPDRHVLRQTLAGDLRPKLQAACLDQECVGSAPLCLAVVVDPARLAPKYGIRAERYCLLEAGHVAENVLLQATALALAAVPVGAFNDGELANLLQLPEEVYPVYVLPVGYPREAGCG
ncbi:MAG TPA: SagB/ThcOx family dehydrogenase [Pirellulales bacterium]|nr:SagB/ThcOx family dehydrogenase [Pirellulales bacterium]